MNYCLCSFARQVSNAAEHVQLYLDRSDRPVAGVTYFALHELIDRLEASNFLQAAAAVSADSETDKVIDQVTGEPDVEVGQQLPVQQLGCE